MSLYIARVAATGADLTSREALDEIARGAYRGIEAFDDGFSPHPHRDYKNDTGYESDKRRGAHRPKQRRLSE